MGSEGSEASKAFEQVRVAWGRHCVGLPLRISLRGLKAIFWGKIYNIFVESAHLTPEGVRMFAAACDEFVAFITTKDDTIVPSLEAKCSALYTALYA
jgi:hypothetical protein